MRWLIFSLLLTARWAAAQQVQEEERPRNTLATENNRPRNNLAVNFFGDGSFYSLHYERLHFLRPTRFLVTKIGVGYTEEAKICLGPCLPPKQFITFPHQFSVNWGKGRHFFETGMGGTIFVRNARLPYIAYGILAYRIQPLRLNRVNFKILINFPLHSIEKSEILFSPLGINIGWSF